MTRFDFRGMVTLLCSEFIIASLTNCGGQRVALPEVRRPSQVLVFSFFDTIVTQEGYVHGVSWFHSHPTFYPRTVNSEHELMYWPQQADPIVNSSEFHAMKKALTKVSVRAEKRSNQRSCLLVPELYCAAPTKLTYEPEEPIATIGASIKTAATPTPEPSGDRSGGPRSEAKANVETVSLYLNVEKNDTFITGLNQNNFRLYEDGQPLSFRLNAPEAPASIALLVEYSQSSVLYLEGIEAAVQAFLKHAPEHNRYALATYDHYLAIHAGYTKQTDKLGKAFLQLRFPMWNEVNTYDAIYEMLDNMSQLPGRRILIVVGSGVDTSSEHTLDDVRKKIEEENVTVFAAGLSSVLQTMLDPYLEGSGRLTLTQAGFFLKTLADKSGGFARFPNDVNAFDDVMQEVMQSVTTQYRIVYNTNARGSGSVRKLKVEAFGVVNGKREDFRVLVREGWR